MLFNSNNKDKIVLEPSKQLESKNMSLTSSTEILAYEGLILMGAKKNDQKHRGGIMVKNIRTKYLLSNYESAIDFWKFSDVSDMMTKLNKLIYSGDITTNSLLLDEI